MSNATAKRSRCEDHRLAAGDPLLDCRNQRRRDIASSHCCNHDTARGFPRCIEQTRIGSRRDEDDIDWNSKLRRTDNPRHRRHLAMDYQLTFIEHTKWPKARALECIEQMRICFCRVERGEYLPADYDHRAESASLGTRGYAHSFEQVRRTIPAEVTHGAHCSGEDDWFFRRQRSR